MVLQWLSLIGAIWLQCINGTNSNFPAYSSQLKHLLSLSQLQLNNLALASDAGKFLGWFSGIAAVYLPLWLVLMIGATLGFIGYGVQYLFVTGQIPPLSYWHIFLLTSLAGNSICWINTVSFIITIQNFPLDRQIAVGLSTSYQGLTAKIFTALVDVVNPNQRAKTYIFLNAVLPLLVCIAASPVAKHVKIGKLKNLAGGFIAMFGITIATGIYAILSSFNFITTSFPPYFFAIGMGLFLVLPLGIPISEKIRETFQKKCWIRKDSRVCNIAVENNSPDNLMRSMEGGEKVHEENTNKVFEVYVREDIGAKKMLQRIDFWLYYFVYLFGATLGMVFLNNLGQIVESRGSLLKTSSIVSLCSSFTFFGRLIPSLLDYYFSTKNIVISRPASIAVTMIPLSGAFFLLLVKNNLCLYISTAIIGMCTGAITSISVPTTTELFGATNVGVNHNILVTNIPVGSFLFGDFAALIYRKEGNRANGGDCMGMKCYQTTFTLWGFLCIFGTFLAIILHCRTKKFYSQNR